MNDIIPKKAFQKPKYGNENLEPGRDVYCLNCGVLSYKKNGKQCSCGMPLVEVSDTHTAYRQYRTFIQSLNISESDMVFSEDLDSEKHLDSLMELKALGQEITNVMTDDEVEEIQSEIKSKVDELVVLVNKSD